MDLKIMQTLEEYRYYNNSNVYISLFELYGYNTHSETTYVPKAVFDRYFKSIEEFIEFVQAYAKIAYAWTNDSEIVVFSK